MKYKYSTNGSTALSNRARFPWNCPPCPWCRVDMGSKNVLLWIDQSPSPPGLRLLLWAWVVLRPRHQRQALYMPCGKWPLCKWTIAKDTYRRVSFFEGHDSTHLVVGAVGCGTISCAKETQLITDKTNIRRSVSPCSLCGHNLYAWGIHDTPALS